MQVSKANRRRGPPRLGPGTALLLVDLQRDFVEPKGSLNCVGAPELLPRINALSAAAVGAGAVVAASMDCHPPGHISFHTSHPGGQPGQRVTVTEGGRQVEVQLFPPHCVAGTWGAQFAEGLDTSHVTYVVCKGTRADRECFSAFCDAAGESTGLAEWLRDGGITTLLVCGVATEHCIRASVLDGLSAGLTVVLLGDLVAGAEEGAARAAVEEMRQAGAVLARGADLLGCPATQAQQAQQAQQARQPTQAAQAGRAEQQPGQLCAAHARQRLFEGRAAAMPQNHTGDVCSHLKPH